MAALLPERWDYLEITAGQQRGASSSRWPSEFADGTLAVSEEYAARIVDSVVTDTPRVIYGNVPNTGLITNLPDGCCVEVPCLVDQNGVQPTYVGDLPAACAGINLASVGLPECVVEAFRQRSRELVYTAVSLDRLTSSLLSLDQIRAMTDEMFDGAAAVAARALTDRPPAVGTEGAVMSVTVPHGTCCAGVPSPPRSWSTTRSAGCPCGCAATPPRWVG